VATFLHKQPLPTWSILQPLVYCLPIFSFYLKYLRQFV